MKRMLQFKSLLSHDVASRQRMILDFCKHLFFFITFYCMNGLVPILICIVAARIQPYGLQYVSSIGFTVAIQLGYSQAALTVVISLLFLKKRRQQRLLDKADPSFYSAALTTIVLYSAIFVPLFIGTAWSYNRYAVNHINTVIGQEAGYMYIYAMAGWIFANGMNLYFIMLVYEYRSKVFAWILYILSKAAVVGLAAAIALGPQHLTPDQAGGYLGLGASMGGIFMTIVTGLIAAFLTPFSRVFQRFTWKKFVFFLWGVFPQTSIIISIQIIKAFALWAMGDSISEILYQPAPMSIQLTRVIWYNYMYFLPFITNGVIDCIFYYGLQTYDRRIKVDEFVNMMLVALMVGLVIQIGFAAGMYFAMVPLGKYYAEVNNPVPTSEWNKYFNVTKVDLPYMMKQLKSEMDWNPQARQMYDALQPNASGQVWEEIYQKAYAIGYKQAYQEIYNGYMQKAIPIAEQKYRVTDLPPSVIQTLEGQARNYAQTSLANPQNQYAQAFHTKLVAKVNSLFPSYAQKVLMNSFTYGNPYGLEATAQQAYQGTMGIGETAGENMEVPRYKTFIYLVFWVNLFSVGQGFNNISYVLKKRYQNIWEAIGTYGIQTVAIGACVGMGVDQQGLPVLPKMDAFTLPLCLAGAVVIIWFSVIVGITVGKAYKQNKTNTLIKYFNQEQFKKYFYYSFKI